MPLLIYLFCKDYKQMSNIIFRTSLKIAVTFGVVASLSLPLATTSYAAAASEEAAVKNLNKLLTGVRSMTASFSQTTQAGNKKNNFSGVMAVQRQNQFRWEIKSPAEQLIVTSGSTLWIYDKDLAQVTKQSLNSQFGDTPALLLSGNPNQISHSFKISQPNDQKNFYVLTPKTSSANFRDLSIAFNGGKPVMIVLNDNIGQTTTIKFTNININKKIAANQFSFSVPSGVEVINQ